MISDRKQQSQHALNEMWLMRRLRDMGAGILDSGVTTVEKRKERVRQAILGKGLANVIIGRGKDGKTMLWAEAFAQLYSEPLQREENAA